MSPVSPLEEDSRLRTIDCFWHDSDRYQLGNFAMTRRELLKRIQKAARDQETELDVSGEDFKELPQEIGQLTRVTQLLHLRISKRALGT